MKRSKGSATDEFLTPPVISEALNLEFGGVGLDPCSNWNSLVEAKMRIMTPANFEIEDTVRDHPPGVIVADGLAFEWDNHGLVFLNCPYSNPAPWLAKCEQEGDEIIALVPAAVADGWWHQYVLPIFDEVFFWEGRLKFHVRDPASGKTVPAPHKAAFGSALLYLGDRVELFRDVFLNCGWSVPVSARAKAGS